MTYLTLSLAVFFTVALAAWRVTDGGWPRKLPMSNILCIILCLVTVGSISQDWRLLWTAAPIALILLRGYPDGTFEGVRKMLWRAAPVLAIPAGLFGMQAMGWYQPAHVLMPILPAAIVLAAAAACPYVRRRTVGWLGHSNRYAEGLEGAAGGLALAVAGAWLG
jgi:hypothetical protein